MRNQREFLLADKLRVDFHMQKVDGEHDHRTGPGWSIIIKFFKEVYLSLMNAIVGNV